MDLTYRRTKRTIRQTRRRTRPLTASTERNLRFRLLKPSCLLLIVFRVAVAQCTWHGQTIERPNSTELWCYPVWDSLLCWPPTKASTMATLRCPFEDGFDTTKFVEKRCGFNGRWEGQNGTVGENSSPNGWANYTTCLTPEMLRLHGKVYTNDVEGEMKMNIAERTRTLEFVGLSISLVALLASLAIFCRFRSLRNTRTRIHKNLFVAMVVQVLIRLTLYVDIEILRRKPHGMHQGIGNTPILCEASYVFLEYAKTAMFMWMFIEGLFLHNVVTVTVFQESSYYRVYRFVGWGCPVVMTLTWATVTAVYYYPKSKFLRCWSGYNLSSYFWILEGPRFAVILLNFLFLLNVIRVLVVKLRQSHTSEIEQLLKVVRAAVVLLPLLGITNVLFMIDAPLDNVNKFALWSYSTHFLRSFQGLFIATLYCFLNGEVRLVLGKTISVYLFLRTSDLQARRQSTFSGCHPQRIPSVGDTNEEDIRPTGWMRLCCRGGNTPPPDRPAESSPDVAQST